MTQGHTFETKSENLPQYDMVIIVGIDHTPEDVARLEEAARNASNKLNICIIGDGQRFIKLEELEELKFKIGPQTRIKLLGHGGVGATGHMIDILGSEDLTLNLSVKLREIFEAEPANKLKKMTLDIYSCFCGELRDKIPLNIRAILHSGQKYSSLISMNIASIIADIEILKNDVLKVSKRYQEFENFMQQMLISPETLILSDHNLEGVLHTFKTAAPKKPLFTNAELTKYLKNEYERFMRFRVKKWKHSVQDVYGVKELPTDVHERNKIIKEQIKKIIKFTPEKLMYYKELALIMECNRDSEIAQFYIDHAHGKPGIPANIAHQYIDVNAQLEPGLGALYLAAENGLENIVEQLVTVEDVDINLQSKYGTALYLATAHKYTNIVKILLNAQADVNLANHKGDTPLHFAAYYNTDALEVLLTKSKNGNPDKRNNEGETPLYHALTQGHINAAQLLLHHGANPDKQAGKDRLSPLNIAVTMGNENAVKLLLKYQANANLADKDKRTPLHHAAKLGNLEIVKMLAAKSDVNLVDKYGDTALQIATRYGRADIVGFLLENGADVNQSDDKEFSPLQIAIDKGNPDVLRHIVVKMQNQFSAEQIDKIIEKLNENGHQACVGVMRDVQKKPEPVSPQITFTARVPPPPPPKRRVPPPPPPLFVAQIKKPDGGIGLHKS